MRIFGRLDVVFDLLNRFAGQFGNEITKLIYVVKWGGTKKELLSCRQAIQEFAYFRNAAILSFIDNRDRELLFSLLCVFEKGSQLFDSDKRDLGIVETQSIQISLESGNEICPGRNERRFSCFESHRFGGQDGLKGLTRPSPVMDEECSFA